MNDSTDAYNDAQAYEQVIKNPNVALRTMQMYYEKGEKIALIHAFYVLTDFWRSLDGSDMNDSKHLEMSLPQWVEDGIKHEIQNSFLKGEETSGKGAKANSFSRTRKDQEHLVRYLAVREVLLQSKQNGKELSIPAAVKVARKNNSTLSPSVQNRAIEKSYVTVDEELSNQATVWKYYPFPDFLNLL